MDPMRNRFYSLRPKSTLGLLLSVVLIIVTSCLSSCSRLTPKDHSIFSNAPKFTPIGRWGMQPFPPFDTVPPESGPCVSTKPDIIATCVELTENIVSLGNLHIIVGERSTGNLIEFNHRKRISVVTHVPVSTKNKGGLLDFILSPEFNSNGLVYALITTDKDIELVRLAPHDVPKPIFKGIPLIRNPQGILKYVGKKLYIAISSMEGMYGRGFGGTIFSLTSLATDGSARPEIFVTDIPGRVGFCPTPDNNGMYIITHTLYRDSLYHTKLDAQGIIKALWTWNTSPGVTDCIADANSILVTEKESSRLEKLQLANDGAVNQQPVQLINGEYGHLNRITTTLIQSHLAILVGTVNKFSSNAIVSDDRVFILKESSKKGPSKA